MEDLEATEAEEVLKEGKEVPFLMLSLALPEMGQGAGQADQEQQAMLMAEGEEASRGLAALAVKVARPPEPPARVMGRAA